MRAGLNPRLLHTIALTPNRIGLRRVQLGMEKELTPDVPLKAKKRRPPHPPSDIDFDSLADKLGLTMGRPLVDRADRAELVSWSRAQGGEKYMSSTDMYRHLNLLENLVAGNDKAAFRPKIDTIFFRASAMLSDRKMVLNLGEPAPKVTIHGPTGSFIIPGATGYVAIAVRSALLHGSMIHDLLIEPIEQPTPEGLFIMVVEEEYLKLSQHITQTAIRMYATAKKHGKNTIRGALTDGREWRFLILHLNEDGEGGVYSSSLPIRSSVGYDYPYRISSPGPDVVAGVLARWMSRSFVDLDETDWFCVTKQY